MKEILERDTKEKCIRLIKNYVENYNTIRSSCLHKEIMDICVEDMKDVKIKLRDFPSLSQGLEYALIMRISRLSEAYNSEITDIKCVKEKVLKSFKSVDEFKKACLKVVLYLKAWLYMVKSAEEAVRGRNESWKTFYSDGYFECVNKLFNTIKNNNEVYLINRKGREYREIRSVYSKAISYYDTLKNKLKNNEEAIEDKGVDEYCVKKSKEISDFMEIFESIKSGNLDGDSCSDADILEEYCCDYEKLQAIIADRIGSSDLFYYNAEKVLEEIQRFYVKTCKLKLKLNDVCGKVELYLKNYPNGVVEKKIPGFLNDIVEYLSFCDKLFIKLMKLLNECCPSIIKCIDIKKMPDKKEENCILNEYSFSQDVVKVKENSKVNKENKIAERERHEFFSEKLAEPHNFFEYRCLRCQYGLYPYDVIAQFRWLMVERLWRSEKIKKEIEKEDCDKLFEFWRKIWDCCSSYQMLLLHNNYQMEYYDMCNSIVYGVCGFKLKGLQDINLREKNLIIKVYKITCDLYTKSSECSKSFKNILDELSKNKLNNRNNESYLDYILNHDYGEKYEEEILKYYEEILKYIYSKRISEHDANVLKRDAAKGVIESVQEYFNRWNLKSERIKENIEKEYGDIDEIKSLMMEKKNRELNRENEAKK